MNNYREYKYPNGFPQGIWQEEPDKVIWEQEGYLCMILRHHLFGNLCGYVGVPHTHPFYRMNWNHGDLNIRVHGGLTFSDSCSPGAQEKDQIICHNPLPGEEPNPWWFGFDCGHCWDHQPFYEGRFEDAKYRDISYVKEEVQSLLAQLKELEK